jgi:hypothetical protein
MADVVDLIKAQHRTTDTLLERAEGRSSMSKEELTQAVERS